MAFIFLRQHNFLKLGQYIEQKVDVGTRSLVTQRGFELFINCSSIYLANKNEKSFMNAITKCQRPFQGVRSFMGFDLPSKMGSNLSFGREKK